MSLGHDCFYAAHRLSSDIVRKVSWAGSLYRLNSVRTGGKNTRRRGSFPARPARAIIWTISEPKGLTRMSREEFEGDGFQTRAIHAGKGENRTHAVTPPIWQTTTFSADSSEHFAEIATAVRPAEFYTRYGNPTHKEVEATLVALEGGEAALLTSSGMGAVVTALMSALKAGDHVVAQTNHYAGAMTLFEELPRRFGIEVTTVDQSRAEAFAEALRPNTRVVYAESPTNPLMQITDLR